MDSVPSLCLILISMVVNGSGQTKNTGLQPPYHKCLKPVQYRSGISQFWTDDYKVFDKIYGKTSDKELYGVTLPPSISFDILNPKIAASDKNERYLTNVYDVTHPDLSDDRYAKLFAKSLYDDKSKGSALQFISFSDFKPISASSDPETYNYLKELDSKYSHDSKYKIDFPDKGFSGFKPYKQIDADIEEKDAYKSIQDILDAHEANKDKNKDENEFENKRKNKNNGAGSKNRNKVRTLNGNGLKSRCTSGRCRKRSPNHNHRPYVRKIHTYVYKKR